MNQAETSEPNSESKENEEVFSFADFKNTLAEYGLDGESPEDRLDKFREMSEEGIALFMADVNRKLQGSDETLVYEKTMKIGDKPTLAPEDRYGVFVSTIEQIKLAEDVSPARVADTLAIATVLLHPFKDGNGRTARALAFAFRENLGSPDAESNFKVLTESRDIARARGGFVIYGYTPRMGENTDQTDPAQVNKYISNLLTEDKPYMYLGPYGQAPLHQ